MDGVSLGRRGRRAAVVSGLVLMALAGMTLPAEAHSITGHGWTDVDQLCIGGTCVSRGNLVGAWQSILWADGYLNKCGSVGIDGVFGTITQGATKSWQKAHGLSSDGIVGPLTWGEARGLLTYEGTQPIKGPNGQLFASLEYWDYIGTKHRVHFEFSDPVWLFRAPANKSPAPYYATSHPDIFFLTC